MDNEQSNNQISEEDQFLSRGARRRLKQRERRERKEALSWWAQPAVLAFLAVLTLAGVGAVMVVRAIDEIPVRQAQVGGIALEMTEAKWILDQMEHGENFAKPSSMMPDMPEYGKQRVTVDLSIRNTSQQPLPFTGKEFELVPESGESVGPYGDNIGESLVLLPGHSFNAVISFDFDTGQPHGKLKVAWNRSDETVFLPIPEPAEHYHLQPRGDTLNYPSNVSLIEPIGKRDNGRRLYMQVYGCAACHGDPEVPGSNNVGPHLGNMANVALAREPGKNPAQYIYESILDPNGFIAPDCKGRPCSTPSAMPEFASLMNLQHVADLVAYMMAQQSGPAAEAPAATPAASTADE